MQRSSSNPKAVVLLSGGIDSSTAMAVAKAEGFEIYAMTFDYGQRHRRELASAQSVANALGVHKQLVVRFDLRDIGGSALTADIAVPKESACKSSENILIPVTYVPARNTVFLSFGLAWAEVLDAETIVIGANAIDYSGYPDCRPEYLQAFEKMANFATKASVEGRLRFRIYAPLLQKKKSEIIMTGTSLGLDYSLTWSCYDPQEKPGAHDNEFSQRPCGQCDSCRIRASGFAEAGIKDPLLC